ncbi:hypothetical protein V4R08_06780 [Nitrobacter sp. NHB1]|uniref:hypothetical protein n=1 Tax=Nitrobacter sp. NHB1 TaxID=3119830 RepID=UPI002FFFF16B
MNRSEMLLAGLAAAGENASFTPVQVQKLFFVLDREAAHVLDGPHFSFEPYDYGPFDRMVYVGIDELARQDLAKVQSTGRYRVYSLSQQGYQQGVNLLNGLDAPVRHYVQSIATWVRQLTFEQLVASIYNKYPEMKVKSVFRG